MTDLHAHKRWGLVEQFDRHNPYTSDKIARNIRENRMGVFSLQFFDADGNRIHPESVQVKQTSHEFKFGCSLFLLDQFPEAERNAKYREAFKKIFNYGVAPLYWKDLEPEKGNPRFDKDAPYIWRRPPVDLVRNYCRENGIRMKGHCLAYNSFNPDWLPDDNHGINIELARRVAALGERYRWDFEDMDVINEMYTIYKNCYKGNGCRDLQITDEPDHEKFCFDLAKREFPCTRLFWNEGCFETFGQAGYNGTRSRYYLMLRRQLEMGTKIEGIGMQFHAFTGRDNEVQSAGILYNALRTLDIFDCYSDFKLPIHLSEISIPSWSNEPEDEAIQAELVERMLTLWFSQKYVDAVVWWNLCDGTAFGGENVFHAGLMRNDISPKPAYEVFDRLINREWHTEFAGSASGEKFVFDGYYGNYAVAFVHNGKKYEREIRLFRDTTGYDNQLADWRISRVKI
ncbi:MAG: endo-1,4-beta-xylanase [Clostridia bacterium]|nr:endo-1,4-beta-xylanase [Clostridia bacterium]